MPRHSFRDPVTNILMAHGFVATNSPGDLIQIEADDFQLEPGKWRWDGAQWVSFISPPLKPSALVDAVDSAISVPTLAAIKLVLQEWRKQIS